MGWVIAFIVIVSLISIFTPGRRCDVCKLPIKRKYYRWVIEGKKTVLCPKCNTQMERRVSKGAFKGRFG